MPMNNGESVGDMIVRHRIDDIKRAIADKRYDDAREIMSMSAPRSLENEVWPPKITIPE